MPEPTQPLFNGWRLDKHVPIALILAIAMQTMAGIWWASSINERVNDLEKKANATSDQAGRIVRLETKLEGIERGVTSIERKLDRLIEDRP